jgi:hypothetical protein
MSSIIRGNDSFDSSLIDYSKMPVGSVIQSKFINSNYSWGSVGHASVWALTWLDITLTTKAANSSFLIMAQYSADDTNSSNFGVGIGSQYSTNGGSSWNDLISAAAHEDYNSVGSDKYKVARHSTMFTLSLPIGTTVIFRVTGRFNNNNGQQFLGNGGTYYAQRHTVLEIK